MSSPKPLGKYNNPNWQRAAGRLLNEALAGMDTANNIDPSGHLAAQTKFVAMPAAPRPPAAGASILDPKLAGLITRHVERAVESALAKVLTERGGDQ